MESAVAMSSGKGTTLYDGRFTFIHDAITVQRAMTTSADVCHWSRLFTVEHVIKFERLRHVFVISTIAVPVWVVAAVVIV